MVYGRVNAYSGCSKRPGKNVEDAVESMASSAPATAHRAFGKSNQPPGRSMDATEDCEDEEVQGVLV